jgi:hypothetical protein
MIFLDAEGVRGSNPLPPTTTPHTRKDGRAEVAGNRRSRARDALGSERYAALTARGAATSYDEIVEYAFHEIERETSETEPSGQ